mmetsp:Transcript_111189/g.321416  ORF Transcript_111189/g.321416 Transcript_111189/m.321416 type:complete len:757 (+) Transcript_111189:242-2512(+)
MLNWGDKEAAEALAAQLQELLKDRTMTFDQLASVYSIKYGQSITQRLKDMSRNGRPMSLGDFITQMEDYLETINKNQVRAARTAAAAGGGGPAAGAAAAAAAAPTSGPGADAEAGADAAPPVVMKYADVSRGVQAILKERPAALPALAVRELDAQFERKFGTSVADVVGMSTEEYLQRKENIFDFDASKGTVRLQSASSNGPPAADPSASRDEAFVVREFEQLIESMGPVVYISTLCGKFIQRNGISVTSVINTRPLDLFKRHPQVFLIVGQGNVTLRKYDNLPDVQRLTGKPSSKASRIVKAAEEAQLPVPDVVTELHVVEEFRRLILTDGTDSVYISSLCGRFLQRFKKPVTNIINCKPAEFLRRYPDVFVMTGGGNVGLREVLGPDAVSVPPPPPRLPKALREENALPSEAVNSLELNDEVQTQIYNKIEADFGHEVASKRLAQACKLMEQSSFLALDELVVGGAVGKGLAAVGSGAAEVVLFVRQLPFRNFPQWLPHILDTLAPVLESQLKGLRAERFKVEKDHLRFFLLGGPEGLATDLLVQVYVSPVFRSDEHLMDSIKASAPGQRFYFYPAFVKERNEFIGRRGRRAQATMSMVAWWATKQGWSSSAMAPPAWLLELVTAHACEGLPPDADGVDGPIPGLGHAVARAIDALANIETVKVLWADKGLASYSLDTIPGPVLSQDPVFMDPLNPYCNLLDPVNYDPRELAAAAQPPNGLFAFKREASKWLVRAEAISESEDDGEEYEDAEEG